MGQGHCLGLGPRNGAGVWAGAMAGVRAEASQLAGKTSWLTLQSSMTLSNRYIGLKMWVASQSGVHPNLRSARNLDFGPSWRMLFTELFGNRESGPIWFAVQSGMKRNLENWYSRDLDAIWSIGIWEQSGK